MHSLLQQEPAEAASYAMPPEQPTRTLKRFSADLKRLIVLATSSVDASLSGSVMSVRPCASAFKTP